MTDIYPHDILLRKCLDILKAHEAIKNTSVDQTTKCVSRLQHLKDCPSDMNESCPSPIHLCDPYTLLFQMEILPRNPLFYTQSSTAAVAQHEAEAKGKNVFGVFLSIMTTYIVHWITAPPP